MCLIKFINNKNTGKLNTGKLYNYKEINMLQLIHTMYISFSNILQILGYLKFTNICS